MSSLNFFFICFYVHYNYCDICKRFCYNSTRITSVENIQMREIHCSADLFFIYTSKDISAQESDFFKNKPVLTFDSVSSKGICSILLYIHLEIS